MLVALAIAALVGMLVPVNAFADYRETFSQGIRAYRAENWRAAAVLMQQALKERPLETGRVQITGNETVPYLPSFALVIHRRRTTAAGSPAWTRRERRAVDGRRRRPPGLRTRPRRSHKPRRRSAKPRSYATG